MKTVSLMVAVPLTVMAYNITIKIDARNIDSLINAVVIAIIILAVVIPSGLYLLAYVRDRDRMAELAPRTPRPRPLAPAGPYGAPYQRPWQSAPPILTTQPTPPMGSFAVQQPMMHDFQPEDWS